METSDAEGFRDAIAALFASFGAEATRAIYRGYWMGLSDLSLADVQRAVSRAIRECQHVPRPIELRRLSGQMDPATQAELAWHVVQRSLPLGPYRHVDFADGMVNATIRQLGGWPTLFQRMPNANEEKWTRTEFLRVYQRLHEAGVNGEMCAALPGLGEAVAVGGKRLEQTARRIECNYEQSGGGSTHRRIASPPRRAICG